MGLFSKSSSTPGEVRVSPTRTFSGGPVTDPEEIGTIARRARLMATAVRVVGSHPVAQRSYYGSPLGDGSGMESVVDVLRPWFASERSLTRWVSIRGALLFLDMMCPNDQALEEAIPAMGLRLAPDPFTQEMRAEVYPNSQQLNPAQQSAAIGLFWSIVRRWQDYDRVSEMTVQQVNADPDWASLNEAIALDYIAWVAVLMWRTGNEAAALQMPEPGVLEQPGWYVDPLFAKSERYWNGQDWTERMRVPENRGWTEVAVPLR